MKNPFKKQPKVKVEKGWEGSNPEGKHTYINGPVRESPNGKGKKA